MEVVGRLASHAVGANDISVGGDSPHLREWRVDTRDWVVVDDGRVHTVNQFEPFCARGRRQAARSCGVGADDFSARVYSERQCVLRDNIPSRVPDSELGECV